MTSPIASAAPAVDIASLAQHIGEIVTLRGWVYHLRSSGKVRFLVVRDGSGMAQGVLVKGRLPEDDFQQFERLTLVSSLRLEGLVRAEPRAPGGYELEVTRVIPVQIAPDYPISPKEHGVAFLMDPPPVAAVPPAAGHLENPGRGLPGLPGLLPRPRLRADRHPHPHPHGLRGHHQPL